MLWKKELYCYLEPFGSMSFQSQWLLLAPNQLGFQTHELIPNNMVKWSWTNWVVGNVM
jgi:hypothetical protein